LKEQLHIFWISSLVRKKNYALNRMKKQKKKVRL